MIKGPEDDKLFEDLRERLLYIARRKIRVEAEAEDVVHNTIMTVVEQYRNGFEAKNLVSWAFGIFAINVKNYYRAKSHQKELSISEIKELHSPLNPEESAIKLERQEKLLSAFERLNEEEIKVVRGLVSGETHQELAQRLNLSKNALYVRIHRVIKKLEKLIHGREM